MSLSNEDAPLGLSVKKYSFIYYLKDILLQSHNFSYYRTILLHTHFYTQNKL